MKILSYCEKDTIEIGKVLGRALKPGDVIGLVGELGSGKTTLVKGIASGLKLSDKDEISSPTFVLIKEYKGRIPLFHFDLYRLESLDDISHLGVDEYLFDQGVCVIEWAERMKMLLPDYFEIKIKITDLNERELSFLDHGKRYKELMKLADIKRVSMLK